MFEIDHVLHDAFGLHWSFHGFQAGRFSRVAIGGNLVVENEVSIAHVRVKTWRSSEAPHSRRFPCFTP